MGGPDLRWGERTYLMGIINVTPDSFAGDGLATPERDPGQVLEAALAQAQRFVEAGADILDVGGESSRPRQFYGDHPEVDEATEVARVLPVVRAITESLGDSALISIDTSKGAVARAALQAGATIVNDVWAARRDPGTATAAAEVGAHLVLMHNQERSGYPGGVFDSVVGWLREAIERATAEGVAQERLIVDPGIGFGKEPADSVELLHRLGELKVALGGLPLMVGTSRKRFIGEILGGVPAPQRVEGTAATVALAIASGVDVVRVHDVEHIARTVRVADAIVRWHANDR